MKTKALISIAALLMTAACGSDDESQGNAAVYDFAAFEAEVEAFIAENDDVDGVGAVIVHRDDGVVFERGFGEFASDRIYLIASSTKMITASVLMKLHDDGILDLDEPVVDMVGWGDSNPDVTVAQLLSNSSGLVGLLPNPIFAPYLCQYLHSGTLQDCARTIFTTELDDDDVIPPDTEFRYGGGQWQVAGGVAEIVSGMSWAELVRDTLIEPCGLEVLRYNNHFVQLISEDVFGYPDGFDSDPSVLETTENPNMEGGVYTTTADYAKLLLMHLRDGMCGRNSVLAPQSVERLHADRILDVYEGTAGGGRFGGYGLGWWVDRGSDSLITDPGAYGSVPWLDEERGYGGFIVLEADSGIGGQLFERLYPLANAAVDAAHG